MQIQGYIEMNRKILFNTFIYYRERSVQTHLKKVYGTLSISMVAAGVGAYVHLFTGLMKVLKISVSDPITIYFSLCQKPLALCPSLVKIG